MKPQSKTSQAVEYYLANKDKGVSIWAAANHIGIDPGAIYRRLKVLEATADQRCPCCGQLVPTQK
jgi:predicted ArsR family transcriptional regulator